MPRLFTDDLGRVVALPDAPSLRIVSLVPSITETVYALGAGANVVGCTRWCIHPAEGVANAAKVGGTKKVNFARIAALQPDLVICDKEENTPEMVAELAAQYPVYVFNIERMADAERMIAVLGDILGQAATAQAILNGQAPERIPQLSTNEPVPLYAIRRPEQPMPLVGSIRVAYLIWENPTMAVGPQTFIDDVLAQNGMANVFGKTHPTLHQKYVQRYPAITLDDLQAAAPDLLLLSSEPYSYKKEDIDAYATQLLGTQLALVNGEVFSWHGVRMYQASSYIRQMLGYFYPTIFAEAKK